MTEHFKDGDPVSWRTTRGGVAYGTFHGMINGKALVRPNPIHLPPFKRGTKEWDRFFQINPEKIINDC